MTSPSQDRLFGANSSMAVKVPCRVATTAAITLSGEQTIDGVAVVTNDRVLVKDQASGVDNGIYIADTSTWQRAPDFDGARDVSEGTLVKVNNGTVGQGFWYVTTTGTITPGTTSIAFAAASSVLAVVSAYWQTVLVALTAAASRALLGAAASGANSDITALTALTSGTPFRKNLLINGGFTVNQRAYVSNAVLASGNYGHDRWKAGSGGGDYTFTQLPSNTQITIKTGKTLIQVVEDKNVDGGSYVLSWTGTAQARAGVNSATPSGSYAASPLTISAQTAGTVMSVEFNEGTLGQVQLESAAVATVFEYRHFQRELALCQRYYFRQLATGASDNFNVGVVVTTSVFDGFQSFPVPMRTSPTALEQSGTAGDYRVRNNGATDTVCTSVPSFQSANQYGAVTRFTTGATMTIGQGGFGRAVNSSAYLGWSAEL